MENNSLRVRVYNTGIGNCTLVSSFRNQHRFHMLIDFGTTERCAQSSNLSDIASDILRETEVDGLDVISVSHTHMDHIMGLCPQENQTRRLPAPSELWMPVNCNPDYDSSYSYRQVSEASRCHEQLRGFLEGMFDIVELLYYREKEPCVNHLVEQCANQNTRVRFLDSNSRPYFVRGPYKQFMIECLHPPPPSQPILMSLLRLLSDSHLERIGIPREWTNSFYTNKRTMRISETSKSIKFNDRLKKLYDRIFPEENNLKLEDYSSEQDFNRIEALSKKQEDGFRRFFDSACTGQPPSLHSLRQICKCIGNGLEAEQIRPIDLARSMILMREPSNDFSMVIRISWEGRKLMFTGDLTYWMTIVPRLQPLDYLEVPHHGSRHNLPSEGERDLMLQPIEESHRPCVVVPTCADIHDEPCCGQRSPDPRQCDDFYSSSAILFHSSQTLSSNLHSDFIFFPDSSPSHTWKAAGLIRSNL